MISEREQYNTANLLVQVLENQVMAAYAQRRNKVLEYVDILSPNRLYWYSSDAYGNVQILQDAAFVCTGVHVVVGRASTSAVAPPALVPFLISAQNLWPPRHATQNGGLPLSLTGVSTVTAQSLSIPAEHFLPFTNRTPVGAGFGITNVDYWYAPVAEWLIDRGDTVRWLFDDYTISGNGPNKPTVVLSGYKVHG